MTDQNSQFFAILTDIGRAKQANATALGTTWTFAQMAVGDANGTEPIPNSSQTKLINERRRAPLNQVKVDPANANVIIAEQIIPESVGGWWIRELGLYDAAGDMVAVANCAPTFKPLLAQGSGRTQVIRINLIVSNTANIELKIDPSVVLATREYVDLAVTEVMSRLDFKHSVLVATTANIVLSGIQTVDGVLLAADARVLVKDQVQAKDNGIYVVPAAGAWKRAQDADASVEVTPGLFVTVEKGTTNGDCVMQLVTDAPIVLGTTALTFEVVAGRTGIVAGTYRSLTVDKLGRVIAGTNPNTLGGYGITNAYTMEQVDTALLGKAAKATTLPGYGITDALSSTPQGVLTGAIADIAKHDIGTYAGPTTDKPTAGGIYVRWKYPGANTLAFDLYAHMASGADTFGFRRVGADGTYTWREVYHSGNFDPSSKADKSQLGTAATLTSATSTTDSTLGRALRVGDFGWGAPNAPGAPNTDADAIEATGVYGISSATTGVPVGAGSGSMLFHMNFSVPVGNQTATQEIVTRTVPARKFIRSRVAGAWGSWIELAAKATTIAGYGITDGPPRGEVIYFPASTPPVGFLKANGALISRTTYAGLFSVIGTAFGAGDGSTTFALPDLRGEFIRGWDDARGVNVGRGINTSELDALQGHYHSPPPGGLQFIGSGAGQGSQLTSNGTGNVGFVSTGSPVSDGTNGTPRTASETRPRNVALLACIRF